MAAQHASISRIRRIDPQAKAARRRRDRRAWTRAAFLSGFFHCLVIVLLLGFLPRPKTVETPPIPVRLVTGSGAAGAVGGTGGGANEPGPQTDGGTAAAARPPDAEANAEPSAIPSPPTTASNPTTPEPAAVTPEPSPKPQEAASTPPPIPTPERALTPEPAIKREPPPPPRKPRPPPRPSQVQAATLSPPPSAEPQSTPAAEPQSTPAATPSGSPAEVATAPLPSAQPGTPGSGEGAGGSSGRGLGAQGAGRGDVGNGDINSPGDDYLDRVRRKISHYKRYPEAAKKQKQEGAGAITFRIARDGTVLEARIERSTGFPLLDDAILKAVHDASPVPPVPDRYRGAELTITMPYDFRIGLFDRVFP